MILIPEFAEVDRTYRIAFYVGESEQFNWPLNFDANIGVATNGYAPIDFMCWPDYENKLGEHERYAFKGWMTEDEYQKTLTNTEYIPVLTDVKALSVKGDMNFYAYFVIEDATKVASDYKLFEIDSVDSVVGDEFMKGRRIYIKPYYASILNGKITFPTKDENGNIIKHIGPCRSLLVDNNVEIYFQEDAQYEAIENNAFKYEKVNVGEDAVNHYSIKAIHLPNTITKIGNYAFNGTYITSINLPSNLTFIGTRAFADCKNLELAILPSSLNTLGSAAFAGCSNITISGIPVGVTHLPSQCFASCPNIKITEIALDGRDFVIDGGVFLGNSASAVTTLSLGPKVIISDLAEGAPVFASNGYPLLKDLYCYNYAGCEDEDTLRRRLSYSGTIHNEP